MFITTHLPDGRRDVRQLEADENPDDYAYAILTKTMGHGYWVIHRYESWWNYARDVATTLNSLSTVEETAVVPTTTHPEGPAWTGIGYWSTDSHYELVGVVPGAVALTPGDLSVGGSWAEVVHAPTARAAAEAVHRRMYLAEDDQFEAAEEGRVEAPSVWLARRAQAGTD